MGNNLPNLNDGLENKSLEELRSLAKQAEEESERRRLINYIRTGINIDPLEIARRQQNYMCDSRKDYK